MEVALAPGGEEVVVVVLHPGQDLHHAGAALPTGGVHLLGEARHQGGTEGILQGEVTMAPAGTEAPTTGAVTVEALGVPGEGRSSLETSQGGKNRRTTAGPRSRPSVKRAHDTQVLCGA